MSPLTLVDDRPPVIITSDLTDFIVLSWSVLYVRFYIKSPSSCGVARTAGIRSNCSPRGPIKCEVKRARRQKVESAQI